MKDIILSILCCLAIVWLSISIGDMFMKPKHDPITVKCDVEEKEPTVWKYYDESENMLCYQNSLGGMACIWVMNENK